MWCGIQTYTGHIFTSSEHNLWVPSASRAFSAISALCRCSAVRFAWKRWHLIYYPQDRHYRMHRLPRTAGFGRDRHCPLLAALPPRDQTDHMYWQDSVPPQKIDYLRNEHSPVCQSALFATLRLCCDNALIAALLYFAHSQVHLLLNLRVQVIILRVWCSVEYNSMKYNYSCSSGPK